MNSQVRKVREVLRLLPTTVTADWQGKKVRQREIYAAIAFRSEKKDGADMAPSFHYLLNKSSLILIALFF